jgi:hypothetical protein
MMKYAVRAVHSCVLQRLRVQLDSDVHASVFGPAAALRLCSSRMFSDESHASNQHLDRGQVVARVLEVVKTHQKVDPSKVFDPETECWVECGVGMHALSHVWK